MSAPKITKHEYEMLAAFRFSLRQFLRFSEEAAHAEGSTPQKHQALLAIKGYPGRESVSIGELAERLQIQHHSAVGLIDRLVADGLIVREPSATDRRQVIICLTPAGEELLEKLASVHRVQLSRVGPELHQLLGKLTQWAGAGVAE
ncbi:MAG: MarR family winged helix-turn-helix transcriptional regulator [Verrucomicrobium sp.]